MDHIQSQVVTNANLDLAIEQLNQGKILIYPTETLYGMGVDAQNEKAVQHLFQIKKRDISKPVPVLLPNKRLLTSYCKDIPEQAKVLIDEFWPGALTIILHSDAFPKGVASQGKVGFRVSSHPLAQALVARFGRCITATSANLSDKETPNEPSDFFKIFPKDSFMLIQNMTTSKSARPSTVIDCTAQEYKIIREGGITKKKIDETLERKNS